MRNARKLCFALIFTLFTGIFSMSSAPVNADLITHYTVYVSGSDLKNESFSSYNSSVTSKFKNGMDCLRCELSNQGDITYRVHYKGGKWLPSVNNNEDYAGIQGRLIDGLMVKTNTGRKISYRVHIKNNNKWLPFVSGYSTTDSDNGYAGILGVEIDQVEINLY